jgi:hypothetical protein
MRDSRFDHLLDTDWKPPNGPGWDPAKAKPPWTQMAIELEACFVSGGDDGLLR